VIPSALNVAALVFPWSVLLLHAVFFKKRGRLLFAIIGATGMYALLLLSVHVLDADIAETLDSFDLDGDGGFTGEEITPDQEKAMADYTNDTGRAMAPITGAVFSVLYGATAFGLWSICAKLLSKVRGNRI
jgi:hypothetical protein